MSAPPPPRLPNGQDASRGPAPSKPKQNPNPLRPMRKRAADPLVARKRNTVQRPLGPPRPAEQHNPLGLNPTSNKSAADLDRLRKQFGGWSEATPPGYSEFPVVTTPRALREGLRHHVMRFSRSKAADQDKPVDPTDQSLFTRPVTLHRRDPRQPPPGRVVSKDEGTPEPKAVDEKEAERQQQLKAEREAQRALDQAKIAPTIREGGTTKKQKKPKEEKIHFNRKPRTEQAQKELDLKYEEALPWHLEDVDGRNVWVGNYVAALSETNVAFVIDGSRFRMVPLEKWYKFYSKPAFERIPEEKVEEYMKKQALPSRWMMESIEKKEEEKKMKDEFRTYGKRQARRAPAAVAETRGYDEVDMEGEEFDDDDDGPGFEMDDEDAKISSARIRQNQLGANLFGDGDEKEVDAKEQHDMRLEMERRLATRKLKRALIKRENVNEIESDSDDSNPFESSSSENESEEEEDQTQVKTEDEDKSAQGASSKGTTTPSGKQKTADASKKVKTLKRPGSPNLSESSGNESARKKAKNRAAAPAGHSRSTTPMPGGQSQAAGQRRKMGAGSTSDGEATGGEMSDGQPRKKKKIKLIASGGRGTPTGSRAASPLPAPAAGSPSASPTKDGQASPRAASPKPPIEAWEIVNALPPPPNGISIGSFLKLFEGRVGESEEPGKMAKPDWIKLVKENCLYGQDKLLRRKP